VYTHTARQGMSPKGAILAFGKWGESFFCRHTQNFVTLSKWAFLVGISNAWYEITITSQWGIMWTMQDRWYVDY
jgi:hypothetical protein